MPGSFTPPRPLAWLAILLVVAAPAAAQLSLECAGPEPTELDSARDAVRDAIRATFQTAAQASGVEHARGLVVVMLDRDGRNPVFRIIEGNLPDAALALAAPHVAGLAAAWPGDSRIRMVVRLDPAPLPACRAGHARRRADPRFVRPDEGRELLCQLARRHASQRAGLGQLVLWVALGRDGHVAYAEIESGEGTLIPEYSLAAPLEQLELRPAMLDGVPQDLLFATQLLVRVRADGAGPQRVPERRAGFTPAPLWDVSRDPSGCSPT